VLPVMIEAMALERSQVAPSVRRHRPTTPWGLESIVRKCLAPDPAQRYQQAEHLAEDLRRFLEDRPLKYAPELSQAEQVRKWMRRHPRLTSSASVATVAALLLVVACVALAGVREHLASACRELEAKQARERLQAYEAGTEKALCLVNTVADLQDHLREGVEVCEETLALYGVLDRDDWQESPAWQRLDEGDRQRLAEDTRELLLLLAWARVRTGGNQPGDLRQALKHLDRADAVQGLKPSRAVWSDRARYLQQAGDLEAARAARQRADQLEPVSARDHYLLATTYARRGDAGSLTRAVAELNQALHLNPQHYWSWVQRGICYQELGETALAIGDFGTCIGLWPAFSWGHFNKGYALDQSGQKAEAIDAYTAALERDPGFLLAYVNRGLARLELNQYRPALLDFDRALELGRDDAFLHTGRGVALEGLGCHPEADAAFALAFTRAESASETDLARIRWVYGFAVSKRLPEKAAEVFNDVLQNEPRHPQALYGRAMLAVEQAQPEQAIRDFDRALEANPSFVDARRYRAILLARQGRFTPACQDINWCLEREPRGGPTLYAAACVLARAADQTLDPTASDKAVDLLEKAFARGYGRDQAAQDPDLAGIWNHPLFRHLLAETEESVRTNP
jgi:eukaryotic-like serine/threonine-protein kinase